MSRLRAVRRRRVVWITAALVAVAATLAAILPAPSGPPPRSDAGLASITSDCSRPVDAELNRYLASVPDGSTVRFKPNGCYRQTGSLWLRDRKDLVLDGNGATFSFDTTTGLQTYYRSNWRILRGSDITLKDMTIRGACKPNQCGNASTPPAKDGYGQHGINLESTARPVIDGVHIRDVLSDGISAEGTLDPACCWRGPSTTDAVIRNSHIERAGRMLIGITNLDGGLIENNVIEDGPEVGIDIELDTQGFKGRRLRIIGNTFDDIHSSMISNGGLGAGADVTDITIQSNVMARRSSACAGGIYLRAPGPNPKSYRSNYVIRDNRLKLVGPMVQAERVRDLRIEGNTVDHTPVGCGEKGAIELIDSHGVTVSRNRFFGYPTVVYKDADSTQVSADR